MPTLADIYDIVQEFYPDVTDREIAQGQMAFEEDFLGGGSMNLRIGNLVNLNFTLKGTLIGIAKVSGIFLAMLVFCIGAGYAG